MNTEVVLIGGRADGKRVDVPLGKKAICQYVYPPNAVVFFGSENVASRATYPQVYYIEEVAVGDRCVIRVGVFESLSIVQAIEMLAVGYKRENKVF